MEVLDRFFLVGFSRLSYLMLRQRSVNGHMPGLWLVNRKSSCGQLVTLRVLDVSIGRDQTEPGRDFELKQLGDDAVISRLNVWSLCSVCCIIHTTRMSKVSTVPTHAGEKCPHHCIFVPGC